MANILIILALESYTANKIVEVSQTVMAYNSEKLTKMLKREANQCYQ